MKSAHVFATDATTRLRPDLYLKGDDRKCLVCTDWIAPADVAKGCPEGVNLVVGLKYKVLIGDDHHVYTALLVDDPSERLLGHWFVSGVGPNMLGTKLISNAVVTVLDVDKEHAFGLWDAIADTVVHTREDVKPEEDPQKLFETHPLTGQTCVRFGCEGLYLGGVCTFGHPAPPTPPKRPTPWSKP